MAQEGWNLDLNQLYKANIVIVTITQSRWLLTRTADDSLILHGLYIQASLEIFDGFIACKIHSK